VGWILNGKELTQEEYEEYRKQKEAEKEREQDEARRLIAALGDAYKSYKEFLAQHPDVHYMVRGEQAQEHALIQKLRQNLERADTAPRCEKVREDGTICGCPKMRGYRYCYAHERMLQTQSQKLQLPALEDANGVQMAIMRVQKALIDDEISEKKAGLLLYSLQMASSNLKHTTFAEGKKEVVTEMVVSPGAPSSPTSKKQVLPLINTDNTDKNTSNWQLANGKSETLPLINADNTDKNTSNWQLANGKSETLPLINADNTDRKPAASTQQSAVRRKRLPAVPRSPELENQNPNTYHGDAEARRSKGQPQPGAAVPHENRVG
jgi:hypothetical protein